MDNRTYWEKRAEIREVRAYSNCLEATNGLVNAYRQAGADIRREINDFYNRFANENGLTYADAVQYLNREEALEWRTSVEGYINEIRREADPVVRERLMQEYDARAYGARITRLESLSGDIDMQLSRLYARANEQFRQLLGENFTEGYYRTIFDIQSRHGYSSMFAAVDPQMVENALTYPWSGANFSDRLWKHKGELLNTLRETLTRGLIRGDSVQDMAKSLSERLNASRANAMRLMRTESSHIHNTAELEAYKACGFEEYEFMASFGERTCEVCGGLDGQRFKLADKQFGVNFPPVHPNCRCTTIAYDPDDNLEDMKSGELDYEQWYEKYVEGREQPRIDSREGAEIELPTNAPAPVLSGGTNYEKTLDKSTGSSIIEDNDNRMADKKVIDEYISLGTIQTSYLEKEFGKLQTNETIVTLERLEHIKERHIVDYPLFNDFAPQALSDPDLIIKDLNNTGTVFVVKRLSETNLNVVVRLSLSTDTPGYKNSVMTFYRIRDKNLKKLENKHKVLYKKE